MSDLLGPPSVARAGLATVRSERNAEVQERGIEALFGGRSSREGIDQRELVDGPRRAHVLGIMGIDSGHQAGRDEHAVPVREAVSGGEVEGDIEDLGPGEAQREGGPSRLHEEAGRPGEESASGLLGSQVAEIFAGHLPGEARLGPFMDQPIQQDLRDPRLFGLTLVDRLGEAVGINGVHAARQGSS